MVKYCKVCHKGGTKGYFCVPNDYRQNEWRTVAGLEPLAPNVKGGDMRICFQHFHSKDLVYVGKQLRVTKGKLCGFQNWHKI